MNVPAPRLYNFLYDLGNQPKICFYRFYPYGSKQIKDLTELMDHDKIAHPRYLVPMICHDQEPLYWDLYSASPTCQVNLRSVLARSGKKYDPVLLLHSEKNSTELEKYTNNRFIGVYYWCHAVIAADWFRFAKVDPVLRQTKNIKYDFLIYNRAWSGTREYRLKFVEQLIDTKLVPNCNIKFNPWDEQKNYKDHVFKNHDLKITRFDFENILEPNTIDATASADYNNTDYTGTGIEVVLETLFDDSRLHLTEKSLRPIACRQPFILAATSGSLEYLKSYGFKTFNGLIDESYDMIVDPVARLNAIVVEMQRIANLSNDQKRNLYAELDKIAGFNQQRFFSDDFANDIFNEYKLNLEKGLDIHANFYAKTNTIQA